MNADRAAKGREAIIAARKDHMTADQLAVVLAGYDRRIKEAAIARKGEVNTLAEAMDDFLRTGIVSAGERSWLRLRAEIIAAAATDIERETLERCLPILPPRGSELLTLGTEAK